VGLGAFWWRIKDKNGAWPSPRKSPKDRWSRRKKKHTMEAKQKPPINKSVTCHFRRQKQKKTNQKKVQTKKVAVFESPKALALQVLACACGSRKFFRIFKRSVFRPTLSFLCYVFWGRRKRFEVYMVSNFVFLVVVCPRTPKKQTNKQTSTQTNSELLLLLLPTTDCTQNPQLSSCNPRI